LPKAPDGRGRRDGRPARVGAADRARRAGAALGWALLLGWAAGGALAQQPSPAGSSSAQPSSPKPALPDSRPAQGVFGVSPTDLAAAPRFALPVRCTLGEDCFVQNYADREPGPGWRDHACGHLAYDGHRGTDFRTLDLAQMERGVDVVAAADGVVAAVRDGEPDVSMRERDEASIKGREAGNAVRVVHDDGWETQYSHLKKGSVRVRPGQRVAAGDVLGSIGLSGKTEFPHLDFVVRHRGRAVDPFAPLQATGCGAGGETLWRPDALATLAYRPVGLLLGGWAGERPDRDKAQRGEYAEPPRRGAAGLTFFYEVLGPRKGDREIVVVLSPDGEVIARNQQVMDRNAAVRFGFVGRQAGEGGWPAGTYTARYRLVRGDEVLIDATRSVELR
jgi:murein DD-endopeptidase MepM/ murein hydrolase activator NlpD